ncbi:MAG: NAD(+) synthetase [Thermoplasmata archaeon]|nr:MAG: NAD(+) synthetase [Thermoplasmata archaeon]
MIDLTIKPEEVVDVITDFIRIYVENSRCKGVVVGLSGGLDSAVTAVLCKKAIGRERTTCLFLPDDSTPESDIRDQKTIVEMFNLKCETRDITSLVKTTSETSVIKPDKMALANIKARIRMVLLFEYANMTNKLVCGTSNKSELLIGYFTKYGDGGVDIMPIGDLYKTQVRDLARFLGIPDEIIDKAPTAGLYKGQLDEKEIKLKYDQLDRILMGLEKKLSIDKIAEAADVSVEEVLRIKGRRVGTQHKRRSPLIPKIGIRTPGLDWRSPVLEG